MPKPRNFLFVCQGNDARGQMARGFAGAVAAGMVKVYAAGVKPKGIDPYAVDVMKEVGIDISGQHVGDFSKVPVNKIDTVITLSSDSDPIPSLKRKRVTQIHWPLTDPTTVTGTDAEIRMAYRAVRDEIRNRVEVLLVG